MGEDFALIPLAVVQVYTRSPASHQMNCGTLLVLLMSVCQSLQPCPHVCLSVSIPWSSCLSVCLSLQPCPHVCLSVSIAWSSCLSVCLSASIAWSSCLSVCLYSLVLMSVCLSLSLLPCPAAGPRETDLNRIKTNSQSRPKAPLNLFKDNQIK